MAARVTSNPAKQSDGVLLRFANGSKFALKEKFVQVYELFFKGQDPSAQKTNFWDELFLLKVNHSFLSNCVEAITEEQLLSLKGNISKIVYHCFQGLKDENQIRVTHALETLCTLFASIFKKKFSNFGTDITNLLVGMEKAELAFKDLILNLESLLESSHTPIKTKLLVMQFLRVIITATDNINQNTLLEYFMIYNMFDSLIKTIASQESKILTFDALSVLIILCNYSKYEKQNPYLFQLSKLSNRNLLTDISANLSDVAYQNLKIFHEEFMEEQAGGVISQLYNWWYKNPASEPVIDLSMKHRLSCCLLAFYELVYSNQEFANLVVISIAESETEGGKGSFSRTTSSSSLASMDSGTMEPQRMASLTFCRFLTLCSHFADDTKDPKLVLFTKICFLAIGCLLENKVTAMTIYDKNVTASVKLYQSKAAIPIETRPRSLIAIIFDLLSLFLLHNLRKNLHFELYNLCLNIIQQSLSFQKKNSTRAKIQFDHLWNALVSLMRFLIQNAPSYAKSDILSLAEKIVNIFNLAILHGNVIFPDAVSFHSLFYEILRNFDLFEALNVAVRKNPQEGGSSRSAIMLNLTNIEIVHSHFQFKIEAWQKLHGNPTLNPQQVFNLIEENMQTLELRKLDKIDFFDRYSEHPGEVSFFKLFLRAVIADSRKVGEEGAQEGEKS